MAYIKVFSSGMYTSVETYQYLHLRVFEGADFIVHDPEIVSRGLGG